MEEIGTKRLVILSHAAASNVSHETFLKDKYEIENLALNSNIKEVVILRTPLVMSGVPGEDRYLDAMLSLLKLPMIYPVTISKSHKFGIVSLNEVTELLIDKTLAPMEGGREIVELKSAYNYSLEDILKYVCKKYVKKQKLGLGPVFGKSLARLINKIYNKGSITVGQIEEIGLLAKAKSEGKFDNFVTSKQKSLSEILISN